MKTILNLRQVFLFTMVAITGILSISCDNEELDDTSFATDDVLSVRVSSPDEILSERFAENNLTINWTTGSNKKTGSSISYLLEIDKAGNDFSSAMQYEMGKNQFLFSMNHKTLMQYPIQLWNLKLVLLRHLEMPALKTKLPQPHLWLRPICPYQVNYI